jgi:pyruvate,water dikinase
MAVAIQAGPHRSRSWAGIPGASGQAVGPVVHIRDDGGHDPGPRAEGAVLICGNIGPPAIRALLRKPAAILSTRGGPLSHAAIVARELGVPCVTAMPAAIRSLPEGTVLHVDGLAGTASPDSHGTADGPAAAPGAG